MDLGTRLQRSRSRSALSQSKVASVLGVTRELVSMWENDQRTPGLRRLEDLAALYRVSLDYLMGEAPMSGPLEPDLLYRGMDPGVEERRAVDGWLRFLDDWAELLSYLGDEERLGGLARPPRALDQGQVTDSRVAPTLALRVRDHYNLGRGPLPNLYSFLDQVGVLVVRATLGSIGRDGGISGAFLNHPKLGYCILVNANTSRGRQAFTLAHEFAHALYHYPARALISRKEDQQDPKEKFADTLASHLLVPAKPLRKLLDNRPSPSRIQGYEVLQFAAYFGVSYSAMLHSLRRDRIVNFEHHAELGEHSPTKMAEHLGLDSADFDVPKRKSVFAERYPLSVLYRTWQAVEQAEISESQAADCLHLPLAELQRALKLLSYPPAATDGERRRPFELPKA